MFATNCFDTLIMSVPAESKFFSPCLLCPSITLRPRSREDSSLLADLEAGVLHHELFHSQCQDCEKSGHEAGEDLRIALCAWCKHLRIWHLLKCTFPAEKAPVEGVYVYPFREESGNCEFCQFLVRCRRNERDSSIDMTKSGTRTAFILSFANLEKDQAVSLCINDAISQSNSCDPFGRSLYAQGYVRWINWALISSWLYKETQKLANMANTVQEYLLDVRIVDVNQQCVRPLPDHAQFVALSYVWGINQINLFQLSTENLVELEKPGSLARHILPQTIQDSMEVCRKVGQRYLWVDRLCILQDDNSGHKTKQLDQMSAIYQQASFTIVASAGQDASYGLPGVSKPRIANQLIMPFRDFAVVERGPYFYNLVEGSVWYTRGW
jgi:hypothetical protein